MRRKDNEVEEACPFMFHFFVISNSVYLTHVWKVSCKINKNYEFLKIASLIVELKDIKGTSEHAREKLLVFFFFNK